MDRRIPRKVLALLVFAIAGGWNSAAQEIHASLHEMVRAADLIFIGKVAEQHTRLNDKQNMIFADVLLTNVHVIHSASRSRHKTERQITVTYAGGSCEGRTVYVSGMPRFDTGKRYLLFILDDGNTYVNPFVGGLQGRLSVLEDQETGEEFVATASGRLIVGMEGSEFRYSSDPVSDVRGGIPQYGTASQVPQRTLSLASPVTGDSLSGYESMEGLPEGEHLPLRLGEIEAMIRTIASSPTEGDVMFRRGGIGKLAREKSGKMEVGDLVLRYPAAKDMSPTTYGQTQRPPGTPLLPWDGRRKAISAHHTAASTLAGGTLGADGYQDLPIVMEQVPDSWWSYSINNDCLWTWNQYMDLYRYTADDGSYGYNGDSEFSGFVSDGDLYDVYLMHWGTALAMTIYWTIPFSGRIMESDVVWNASYSWTSSANYAIGNPNVILLRPVAMHELGHTWGLMSGSLDETYDYDVPTVMHSYYHYLVEDGWGIHASDAHLLRRNYKDQTSIAGTVDVGVESYYAAGGLINATTSSSSYFPGQSITVKNLTVENISYGAVANLRLRLFLSTDRTVTTGDRQIGSYWEWSSFSAEARSTGSYTATIPMSVPAGTYYVGAIVTINGYQQDNFASNNSTSLYGSVLIKSAIQIAGYVRTTSGTGVSNVVMTGLPGNPVTDAAGHYAVDVPYSWSGAVQPSKIGYTFSPSSRAYSGIVSSQTGDYSASPATFTISGHVRTARALGVANVTMTGLPGTISTDVGGLYQATVQYGWTGTVVPSKTGYAFSPTSTSYAGVSANVTNDYVGIRLPLWFAVRCESTPSSLPVWWDDTAHVTPFVTTCQENSIHRLVADTLYRGGDSVRQRWQSWSDGGTTTRSVVVTRDTVFRADYRSWYRILVTSKPLQGGTTDPTGEHWSFDGDIDSLWATPGRGYVFTGWGGDTLSTLNPLVLVASKSRRVAALFAGVDAGPVAAGEIPTEFNLYQNYPNPFNPGTSVRFDVPAAARIVLSVSNILGQVVAVLVDAEMSPGRYRIDWDGSSHPSGLYLCRIQVVDRGTGDQRYAATRKMLIVR
jgi:hypothetical protein